MSALLICLGMLCLLIRLVLLLLEQGQERRARPARASAGRTPPGPAAPAVRPRSGLAPSRRPPAQTMGTAPMMNATLQKFGHIKLNDRITVRHPVRGDLTVQVQGRFVYAELWQTSRGPQSPWTPTGNLYAGFWLSTDMLLLNWQNRVYLLDEREEVSDAQIARDFAPHARKFAQSDQTADVYFAYPPVTWHIDDIGKFRVETVAGMSPNVRSGAVGRLCSSAR